MTIEIKNATLLDLRESQEICRELMRMPHYAKMGQAGILAIIEAAKSLGIDPRKALNGGLYCINGKIEMSSRLMNSLIRNKKHSVTKDRTSNDTICILHGKRSDNGDTWTESFSIKEAITAGILRGPWKTYPRDMLFARALSRLARQLFPDVIGDAYVEGEIDQQSPLLSQISEESSVINETEVAQEVPLPEAPVDCISYDDVSELNKLIGEDKQFRDRVLGYIDRKCGAKSLYDLPLSLYEDIMKRCEENLKSKQPAPVQDGYFDADNPLEG